MRPPSDYNDARMPAEAEEPDRRAPAMMICARLAGRAIIRVVGRCEDAQENSQLAVTRVILRCEDAQETQVLDLNLSNNQIAKLPDELCALTCLQRLDVSHNSFVALPHIACQCPSLHTLLAHHNQIIEVDVTRLSRSRALEYVDLSDNPIPPRTYEELQQITQPRISMSERQKEDWEEDLIL
ncbi:unnamed protein product [Leptidea sinapis]|uniref:U2A'/phosphoprotein 32 family A C-terminal domain-containing protein n=1 Tax=Leptidea sinapis TaxID=189913 RepID=A0A5E4QYC4_9NEOP|nr:unnamed protein product [Leptidea sinapis]